jgi:threonine/homoserine/homoserine lactone efflux protein
VTSYSIAYGRRVNPFLVGALALGDGVAICVSLLGLGSLLSASPFWFGAVRCAGALYLAYMGVSLFRRSSAAFPTAAHARSRWRIFWSTFVLTAVNPKGLVFYVAFLPQFVDTHGGTTGQLSVLAGTVVALSTSNATLYATLASSMRRMLDSAGQHRFNIIAGSLLVGIAIWALSADRLN